MFLTHCGCLRVRIPICSLLAVADFEEGSWTALDDVGVSKTARVMKLLDLKAFELKSDIHQVFNHVWKTLVQVDTDLGKIAIYNTRQGQLMQISTPQPSLLASLLTFVRRENEPG